MKVKIELDQGFQFFPVTPERSWVTERDLTMEIPEALWQEYQEVERRHSALHEQFEQLYRIQEGMEPHDYVNGLPIPEHQMLEKTNV